MSESLWYSKTKLILLAAVLIVSGCSGGGLQEQATTAPGKRGTDGQCRSGSNR